MKIPAKRKSSWPRQTALVVSDAPNMHMLLRELVKSCFWTVIDSTSSSDQARVMIQQGEACLIITDDSPTMPASRNIRAFLNDPTTLCTPVFTFLSEQNKTDARPLSLIGRPQIVEKPLTPSKFVPNFSDLVRAWEKEPLISLRRANYEFIGGNVQNSIRVLKKLLNVPGASSLATQTLALHLRRADRLKDAESVLLGLLKRDPRNLGTMLSLVDLYMHASMPHLARRLLLGIRASCPGSLLLHPDLIQSALAVGNLDEAIAHLQELQKNGITETQTQSFLARLFMTEGRDSEAERALGSNKTLFKRMQQSWLDAENQPMPAAG